MIRSLRPHLFAHAQPASRHCPAVAAGPAVRRGRCAGPAVVFRWSGIARLKAGQLGALAEDYVEGKLQLEGAMRDVMRAMLKLLPGNPTQNDTGWWPGLLHRARSLAAHTQARDAAQIQFHYDVSDAFYALWLDPRRVYSCAYYRTPA